MFVRFSMSIFVYFTSFFPVIPRKIISSPCHLYRNLFHKNLLEIKIFQQKWSVVQEYELISHYESRDKFRIFEITENII